MKNRLKLRSQIEEAWDECVREDYKRQRINSQRSLQASLWASLNQRLPAKTRCIFIEPALKAAKSGTKFPGIVICNSDQVIGIIDLKYTPRSKPSWKKDLATFEWIGKNFGELTVSNKKNLGKGEEDCEYTLADDLVYVWAGIHQPWDDHLKKHIAKECKKCFMELHLETKDDVE
jgi:hypothetical protein